MEYLLPLIKNYNPSMDIINPEFDLVFEDEKGPNYNPDERKESEEIYVYIIEDVIFPEDSNVLKTKQLKSLDTSVLTQLNAAEAYISQTLTAAIVGSLLWRESNDQDCHLFGHGYAVLRPY